MGPRLHNIDVTETNAKCCDDQCLSAGVNGGCPATALGIRVELQTVKALLTPAALQRVEAEAYWFCPSPDCEVVSFNRRGQTFTTDDLRARVWAEANAWQSHDLLLLRGKRVRHLRRNCVGGPVVRYRTRNMFSVGCESRTRTGQPECARADERLGLVPKPGGHGRAPSIHQAGAEARARTEGDPTRAIRAYATLRWRKRSPLTDEKIFPRRPSSTSRTPALTSRFRANGSRACTRKARTSLRLCGHTCAWKYPPAHHGVHRRRSRPGVSRRRSEGSRLPRSMWTSR